MLPPPNQPLQVPLSDNLSALSRWTQQQQNPAGHKVAPDVAENALACDWLRADEHVGTHHQLGGGHPLPSQVHVRQVSFLVHDVPEAFSDGFSAPHLQQLVGDVERLHVRAPCRQRRHPLPHAAPHVQRGDALPPRRAVLLDVSHPLVQVLVDDPPPVVIDGGLHLPVVVFGHDVPVHLGGFVRDAVAVHLRNHSLHGSRLGLNLLHLPLPLRHRGLAELQRLPRQFGGEGFRQQPGCVIVVFVSLFIVLPVPSGRALRGGGKPAHVLGGVPQGGRLYTGG
mmetsp:Transcript_27224/g.51845  ORF Transcript_27224/g.51845 Transcript_27224/m.51845 type:complete len:281 (+) Transcript_27224:435-1277(+)